MFAAPSASEQLHILASMAPLNWKQRLLQYEQMADSLPKRGLEGLLEVEVCFLEMLKEKNLNVAVRVIELIRSYVQLQPITKVSAEELLLALFNFSTVAAVQLETLVVEMYARNDRLQLLQGLSQCCRSKNTRKSLKGYRALRMLIDTYEVEKLLWLEHNLEDIRFLLQSSNPELTEQGKHLVKALYARIGDKAIELAQKSSCAYLNELTQFAQGYDKVQPFQSFPGTILSKRFDLLGKYCQDNGFDQLKIKQLNQCLRELLEDSERDAFTEGSYAPLLTTFISCARRGNKTTNRLIMGIVTNLAGRIDLRCYSQLLLDILFELVGSEQLKHSLAGNALLRLLRYEEYMQKLSLLTTQTDYHKAIVLLELMKESLSQSQESAIREWFSHIKLNIVYRLQLQSILAN